MYKGNSNIASVAIEGKDVIIKDRFNNTVTAENAFGKLTQVTDTENGTTKLYSAEDSTSFIYIYVDKDLQGKSFALNNFDSGNKTVYLGPGANITEGITLTANAPAGQKLSINGTDYNDTLDASGSSSNNVSLMGYKGNDVLKGGNGNDTLDGGAGKDEFYGGDGNNKMYAGNNDNARDTFYFDSDCWGTNTIYGFSAGTGSNNDNIILSGISVISQGTSGDDQVLFLSTNGSIELKGCAGQTIQISSRGMG